MDNITIMSHSHVVVKFRQLLIYVKALPEMNVFVLLTVVTMKNIISGIWCHVVQ
jgi:hypothetical protein